MDEIRVEHSRNVIAASTVSANGDVLVGGQKVTNYFYSAQYQDLKKQLGELQAQFSKTRQKTKQYPNDEDFKTELLQIDEKRNEVQKKLDDLKSEVMRLAETFVKIPINTQRLKFAREHFEIGDYAAARAVLDAEQMANELDALLGQKEQLQHQQAQIEANLTYKAYEFLILARLTAIDYTLPDRYDKTVGYFEQSLKTAHTADNTGAYADFLKEHNQFNAALPFYTEAVAIHCELAESNPQRYLPDLAGTLNNLAVLQQMRNEFNAAAAGYQEALAIYRRLGEANPAVYLPQVALTLNNLGTLQKDKNEFDAAEMTYGEALAIQRSLAELNPQMHLRELAGVLNNLAVLQQARNKLDAAEATYTEALAIRRRMAKVDPQSFAADVADTLNNLGALQKNKNEFDAGKAMYQEALAIYRHLADANPQRYLRRVALTLYNLGNLQNDTKKFGVGGAAYQEALAIYRRLAEANPQTYLPNVAGTLNNLASLQKDTNEFDAAEAGYQEALAIYRRLAEANPQTYLPDVAMTLYNLAQLQKERNELSDAAAGYQEALEIYRILADRNPKTYLPDVAGTLDRLANLQTDMSEFGAAEAAYQEAYQIYKDLINDGNPRTYLLPAGTTAAKMGIFYVLSVPNREKSLTYAKQALIAVIPLIDKTKVQESIPAVLTCVKTALNVAAAWGLDDVAFFEEANEFWQKPIEREQPLAVNSEPEQVIPASRPASNQTVPRKPKTSSREQLTTIPSKRSSTGPRSDNPRPYYNADLQHEVHLIQPLATGENTTTPKRTWLALGQTFRNKLKRGGEGPLMVVIPPGLFLMGSPTDELERLHEDPRHTVLISQPFAIGAYAVTFDEYDCFCESTQRVKLKDRWGRGNQPVNNVAWIEAQAYCDWLSEQTARTYRLPTEAEWEYACRAGTDTPFNTGAHIATNQANFNGRYTYKGSKKGEYRKQPVPVGTFPPNAFGLYEMHGNVIEWTCSAWREQYDGNEQRCADNEDRNFRALRGGFWNSTPGRVRSAARTGMHPYLNYKSFGFRVLCNFF